MAKNDFSSDERLTKSSGEVVRGDRASADADRVQQDGSALSVEERRQMLRKSWVQEVLPAPPEIPGFHLCWLSTTNGADPIYKRIQRGYVPVKSSEVPGFGTQFSVKDGEFSGCIACNEMVLFKLPSELYNDIMVIQHHELPIEQEEGINERINSRQDSDSQGQELLRVEGAFKELGRKVKTPTFT